MPPVELPGPFGPSSTLVFSFRGDPAAGFEARSDPFSWFALWPMELVAEGVEARSRLAARDRSEPFPRGIDLTDVAQASRGAPTA